MSAAASKRARAKAAAKPVIEQKVHINIKNLKKYLAVKKEFNLIVSWDVTSYVKLDNSL